MKLETGSLNFERGKIMCSKKIADNCFVALLPIVQSYVRILRAHPMTFPRRTFSRNTCSNKIQIELSVPKIELPNGACSPGPIHVDVKINSESVFRADVGGSAVFVMMDGLSRDTKADIETAAGEWWVDVLEKNLPYLIREAALSR